MSKKTHTTTDSTEIDENKTKKPHHKEHHVNHKLDHETSHETEKKLKHSAHSSSKSFLDKHLNTVITILSVTIILVGGFGGIWYYQQTQQQTQIPTFINQDPDTRPKEPPTTNNEPKLSPEDLEKIKKLSISKDIPELKDFVIALDPGTRVPSSSLEIDKQAFLSQDNDNSNTNFISGLDLTLSTDFDQNNQKEALVQSIYMYKEGFTEKLKIKDYSPAGYQKIACENIGDECGILYKKAIEPSKIDSYKVHVRKNNILIYLEYAGNPNTHPEHDVEWLKKVTNTLLSKI